MRTTTPTNTPTTAPTATGATTTSSLEDRLRVSAVGNEVGNLRRSEPGENDGEFEETEDGRIVGGREGGAGTEEGGVDVGKSR
jgi:hypothetical protein